MRLTWLVMFATVPAPPAAPMLTVSGPFVNTYFGNTFVNTYFWHNQQHFAYLAANGDIWDAYYCGGCSGDNKWRLQKINNGGVTNGPPAASAPFVEEFWTVVTPQLVPDGNPDSWNVRG